MSEKPETVYIVQYLSSDGSKWYESKQFTTTEETYDYLMHCRETWPDDKFRSTVRTTKTVILDD